MATNLTDTQMLHLAARAVGYKVEYHHIRLMLEALRAAGAFPAKVDRQERRVVCSAVRYLDERCMYIVTGVRHFDQVMQAQLDQMSEDAKILLRDGDQGFLDQHGVFMDREEAFLVALISDQIIKKTGNPDSKKLFSEDIY